MHIEGRTMQTSNTSILKRVIHSLREQAKAVADAVTLVDPPMYR